MNNDKYTRRCFEIPACGTMMLAQKTNELKSLYKEGTEAAFFSGKEDLLDKIIFYLQENRYNIIGEKGKIRAIKSGYDVNSRVKEFIDILKLEDNEKK